MNFACSMHICGIPLLWLTSLVNSACNHGLCFEYCSGFVAGVFIHFITLQCNSANET